MSTRSVIINVAVNKSNPISLFPAKSNLPNKFTTETCESCGLRVARVETNRFKKWKIQIPLANIKSTEAIWKILAKTMILFFVPFNCNCIDSQSISHVELVRASHSLVFAERVKKKQRKINWSVRERNWNMACIERFKCTTCWFFLAATVIWRACNRSYCYRTNLPKWKNQNELEGLQHK